MAGGAAEKSLMTVDEAWPILQEEAINKLIANLEIEGLSNHSCFTSEEYMRFYTVVYNVCAPNPLSPEAGKLYGQYKRTFEDYISCKVLPSLRGKENENLLKELLRRWNNHKIMSGWLSRFFNYLSRYYIPKKGLPSLVETNHLTFCNLVHREFKDQVSSAVVSLIDRVREGEQIDQVLMKPVQDMFDEIGENAMENYAKDIEEALVEASAKFYSRMALDWMATKSYEDYMLKVEECLQKEKPEFQNT